MANSWFRLWHDMPFDPKFRSIARAAQKPLPVVLSTYLFILVNASNATERGRTHNLVSEDIANALDVSVEDIDAVRAAMQGRVLDGDILTGWSKRQPNKEDGSAERARLWRLERKRTKANAKERPDKDKDTEEIKDLKTLPKDKPSAKKIARVRKSQAEDERFTSFREAFENYFEGKSGGVPAPWDGKEGANLARWLRKNPTITLEQWQGILDNRTRSPVNHALELSMWLGKALTWVTQPANEFGQGGGYARNGAGRDKFAETREAYRTASERLTGDFERAHGDVLLPTGGADGGVSGKVFEATSPRIPPRRARLPAAVGRDVARGG